MQLTHIRAEYWAVEVPEGAQMLRIGKSVRTSNTLYFEVPYDAIQSQAIYLPPGTWSIVCTSKEASYDQCGEIAGVPEADVVHGYNQTLFNDLLTSKGLDVNNNYLILKKIQ